MLSNNDGCAMGRSAAAKGSGIIHGFSFNGTAVKCIAQKIMP
jgi:hypothetical protein